MKYVLGAILIMALIASGQYLIVLKEDNRGIILGLVGLALIIPFFAPFKKKRQ